MSTDEIRRLSYRILEYSYPAKMTAGEIARFANIMYGIPLKRKHIHNALRNYAVQVSTLPFSHLSFLGGYTIQYILLMSRFVCTSSEELLSRS